MRVAWDSERGVRQDDPQENHKYKYKLRARRRDGADRRKAEPGTVTT